MTAADFILKINMTKNDNANNDPISTFLMVQDLLHASYRHSRDDPPLYLCEGISDLWDDLSKAAWYVQAITFSKQDPDYHIWRTLSVKIDGHEVVMPGAFEWTVDTTFLMDQASPSKFGHGAETKMDTNVRHCFEIAGDRVQQAFQRIKFRKRSLKNCFKTRVTSNWCFTSCCYTLKADISMRIRIRNTAKIIMVQWCCICPVISKVARWSWNMRGGHSR